MDWLTQVLNKILFIIYSFIPNWGFAIIALALLMRILLYPISKWAAKSQEAFTKAQNKISSELGIIKEKYKGGEQSERILRLYKKHNISPFAGLKPLIVILLQLPILLGLFQVLGSNEEFIDASFLWIDSLSEPDKLFNFGQNIPLLGEYFNLLPFLMSGVSLIPVIKPVNSKSIKMSKNNSLLFGVVTIIFFFLFYSFPSGMILYWTCATAFQVFGQRLSNWF